MFNHQDILNRITEIELFFNYLGLIKKNDLPKNWNLDSSIKYAPKDSKFIVYYKNRNRVLISIEIGIVSGLILTLSGNYLDESSVYKEVHTDYFFKEKYGDFQFFIEEMRDYKLKDIIQNEV
jgi:hypothetical protein